MSSSEGESERGRIKEREAAAIQKLCSVLLKLNPQNNIVHILWYLGERAHASLEVPLSNTNLLATWHLRKFNILMLKFVFGRVPNTVQFDAYK